MGPQLYVVCTVPVGTSQSIFRRTNHTRDATSQSAGHVHTPPTVLQNKIFGLCNSLYELAQLRGGPQLRNWSEALALLSQGHTVYQGQCGVSHHCGLGCPRVRPSFIKALTHLPLDKMAAILADDIFKCIFLNLNVKILIKISLKLVPRGSIDNKPALVQLMAWRRTGDKPLSKPMLTQFTDAYMLH